MKEPHHMPHAEDLLESFDEALVKATANVHVAHDALLAALASTRRDGDWASVSGAHALEKIDTSDLLRLANDLRLLAELGARH